MYGKDVTALSESEKQTISALATLAAGIAGGLTGDSTASAVAGAQAGKTTVENNSLSLPKGMTDYGLAVESWSQYAVDNNLSPEQTQAGLNKLAKGDLPDGANISKVIVEAYGDGALIAGAWYLGPAASVGKVLGGGLLGLAANSGYQIYDLNQPQNADKSWDYLGSATSFTTGMLAPGRGVLANTGIAVGGAFFTDGPNSASITGAAFGGLAGGSFGKFAPVGVDKALNGNNIPSFVYDVIGGVGSEFINGFTKEALKTPSEEKSGIEK
ncbi:VENN motif pre-toxin domain-containing protein [Enterobacter nematophilus]|uniref:VENN motif pre-toxin domain-containing protein n=1 Tax=Enterobacter nematophilus TaxID=2994648 RepID=UPI0039C8FA5A